MATRIRLSRTGRRHLPLYRLVVADGERPRDGKFIEVLGTYDPKKNEQKLTAKLDRVQYWMSKGAKPTETVALLLKKMSA